MDRSRRSCWIDAAGVALAAWVSRLFYLTRYEQDLDGSRFVRGVMQFDLLRGHPHPPGYPVYVGVATLIDRALVHQPAVALSVTSALGFALLVTCTFVIARQIAGSRLVGVISAVALALGTTVTVHATRPLSDMLGAGLGWAVVACACFEQSSECEQCHRTSSNSVRMALAGIALFGLLCGTRVSTVPVALPALVSCVRRTWKNGAGMRVIVVALVSISVWLVPLVAVTGIANLSVLTWAQAEGHFARFGGSVVTESNFVQRIAAFGFGLWAHVLGGFWSDRARSLTVSSVLTVVLIASGVVFLLRARLVRNPSVRMVLGCAGLYGVWAFFGQNVIWQPRHLIPVAPAFAIVTGLGLLTWKRIVRTRIVRIVAIMGAVPMALPLAMESHRLARVQARERPPAVRIAEYLRREVDPRRSLVATQLEGWLRFRAPTHRIWPVMDAREARALGERAGLEVFLTSEVPGAWELEPRPVFHVVGDRYVWSTMYDLALLRVPEKFH